MTLVAAAAVAGAEVNVGDRRAAADHRVLQQHLVDRRAVRVVRGIVEEALPGEELRDAGFVVVVERPRVIEPARTKSMCCSRPTKSASGSFSVKPCVPPPVVGHHSRGCESGVNTMHEALGKRRLSLELALAQERRQEHGARRGLQQIRYATSGFA